MVNLNHTHGVPAVAPTDKDAEWKRLREWLGDTNWTVGEAFTYREFFCWGWERARSTAGVEEQP